MAQCHILELYNYTERHEDAFVYKLGSAMRELVRSIRGFVCFPFSGARCLSFPVVSESVIAARITPSTDNPFTPDQIVALSKYRAQYCPISIIYVVKQRYTNLTQLKREKAFWPIQMRSKRRKLVIASCIIHRAAGG